MRICATSPTSRGCSPPSSVGHRPVRISLPGPRQPHRLRNSLPCPAQDSPGGHHPFRLRALRPALHAPVLVVELCLGCLPPHGRRILPLPRTCSAPSRRLQSPSRLPPPRPDPAACRSPHALNAPLRPLLDCGAAGQVYHSRSWLRLFHPIPLPPSPPLPAKALSPSFASRAPTPMLWPTARSIAPPRRLPNAPPARLPTARLPIQPRMKSWMTPCCRFSAPRTSYRRGFRRDPAPRRLPGRPSHPHCPSACCRRPSRRPRRIHQARLSQRQDRFDLAEAVLDLIHARSERAARLATAQLEDALAVASAVFADALLALCADIESMLGFPG